MVQGHAFLGVDHIQGLISVVVLMPGHLGPTQTPRGHCSSGASIGSSRGQACNIARFLPLSTPAALHSILQVTIPEPLLNIHDALGTPSQHWFPKGPNLQYTSNQTHSEFFTGLFAVTIASDIIGL